MSINCVLVIGLGRIGLPQALDFANFGLKVYAYDSNPVAIESLKQCQTPFYEPSMDKYLKATINKEFYPYSSWIELEPYLKNIDAIVFTIGTSIVTEQDVLSGNKINLSEYFKLLDQIFFYKTILKPGIKLIIRTTLPLGGTDSLKNYIETKHSLREGNEFYLAFVPERITEGVAIKELTVLPKIIGAYQDEAFEDISKLFMTINANVIRVKNPITAEFCKLTDNAFRSTLFSFANEIAMYGSKFHIDVNEVVHAVNYEYERNHIPLPGFVSGYCLSKDPYIFELDFAQNMQKRDFHSVWYYGRKTNDYLVEFVVQQVLQNITPSVNNCVSILGLSFKENVDDFRYSHTFDIIDLLIKNNVKKFKLYDPYLNRNKYTTISSEITPYIIAANNVLDAEIVSDANAIVVCVRHEEICSLNNFEILDNLLKSTSKPCYIFDGWNILGEAKKILHVEYESLGIKKAIRTSKNI